jgi:SAM-dependent methyltransferase
VAANSTSGRCAACGGEGLELHLRVGGEPGPEGLIPSTDRFGTALADIARCTACGHMQLTAFPSREELEQAYADASSEDYVEEEAGQRATARRTLSWLGGSTGPGRLLDLGCWVGFLLDEARICGWETVGVEPSRFASDFARDRLGLDVRTDDLFSCPLPERSFDAVILGDVIEHLPDPGAALDRIASLTRPGGVLLLTLPDAGSRLARWLGARWWSVLPTHVQYFTRSSLRTLLTRHGFTVLAVRTAPKAFTVRYYLDRLSGYSPALGRVAVRATQRVGVAERIWAPDFRDRMAVLARAPG